MFKIPKRFRGIKRFEKVLSVITKYELGYYLEKTGLKKRSLKLGKKKRRIRRPLELRLIFEELGGTFIKLGQLLSLRPDLIPKEYCDELSKLQDDIEHFSYQEVNHVLKSEFGKPANKLFKSFDKKPVSTASIGQVHVARLKNNKKVAVKVMRPGIRALIETDLEILEYLARVFKHHFKQDIIDPKEIFSEFKQYSENELDYLKEAHVIKDFYSTYKQDRKARIPRVYDKLTSKRVLTMEYLDGVKLKQIMTHPKKYKRFKHDKIASLMVQNIFTQVFVKGLFHADPHPGNIIVKNHKTLGFIDFGITGRINMEMKEKLGRLFYNLLSRDASGLVKSFISLNLVDSEVDITSLKNELCNALGEYYDTSIQNIDMTDLFFKSIKVARKHKIKVSRDFVLLGKSLVTLQGVCIELDPDFNLVHEAKPFIEDLIKQKQKPAYLLRRLARESEQFARFVQELPEESQKVYRTVRKADISLENINIDLRNLNKDMRTETWRVVLGMIIAALIIGASLTYRTEPGLGKALIILAFIILAYLLYTLLRDSIKNKNW